MMMAIMFIVNAPVLHVLNRSTVFQALSLHVTQMTSILHLLSLHCPGHEAPQTGCKRERMSWWV